METKVVRIDAQSLADVVTTAVKSATAPVLERLAVAERTASELRAEVVTLRERVAAAEVRLETKSLLTLLEKQHADMRDRIIVLEAGAVTHHGR